jgi:predicted RNA methylase
LNDVAQLNSEAILPPMELPASEAALSDGNAGLEQPAPNLLKDLCVDLEAFETPRWALEAVLRVEICTPTIIDPCAGTGIIARVCLDQGYNVFAIDIHDWSRDLPASAMHTAGIRVVDFLTDDAFGACVKDKTVFMNPPFSKACEFVDRALALGARKVITFQRQAWRESESRREWWQANRPSRVWVCGSRATCWRFDLLECRHEGGTDECAHFKAKGKKKPPGEGCSKCLGGAPTAHGFFVWERGHSASELTDAIYPEKDLA